MRFSPHLPAFIKSLAAGTGPWRLIVLSGIVGVVAGLGAIVFFTMLESGRHLMLGCLAGYVPDSAGGELPMFESPGAAVPQVDPAVLRVGPRQRVGTASSFL